MPRPGSLGKSLLRMAFGPGRLSEYYYYYYYYCSLALKGHPIRTYRIVPASRTVGGILEMSRSPSS